LRYPPGFVSGPVIRLTRGVSRGVRTEPPRSILSIAILAAGVVASLSRAHAASVDGGPGIRYEVTASAGAIDLGVEAELPPRLGSTFTVDPQAVGFVDGVGRAEGSGWVALPRTGNAWSAPGCRSTGCRIRYVFHLARAARSIDDPDTAATRGETLVAPASTWLLRPQPLPEAGLPARLHVRVSPPLAFVTGLPPVAGAASTFSVELLPSFVSPYSAFGQFHDEEVQIGGATLRLAVATPALDRDRMAMRSWVMTAARAVTAYFGRFPVDRALVLAVPQGAGVHGKAMGGGGATVLLQIAPGTELTDPGIDWQATHEMVHLAVPEMSRAQIWLSEGLATYVEPLARSLTGELRPESVWRDLMVGLPKGLPGPGDRGLDRTHTWGRTYWGGALFAFLADLEIRQATGGAQSLATALRGVLREGGDARVSWSVERFNAACDRAVGKPILTNLYRRWASRPVEVDLAALWRQLGVSLSEGRVSFDDGAPLAGIRRAMIGVPAAADPQPGPSR
jgi:hypothetical protein